MTKNKNIVNNWLKNIIINKEVSFTCFNCKHEATLPISDFVDEENKSVISDFDNIKGCNCLEKFFSEDVLEENKNLSTELKDSIDKYKKACEVINKLSKKLDDLGFDIDYILDKK